MADAEETKPAEAQGEEQTQEVTTEGDTQQAAEVETAAGETEPQGETEAAQQQEGEGETGEEAKPEEEKPAEEAEPQTEAETTGGGEEVEKTEAGGEEGDEQTQEGGEAPAAEEQAEDKGEQQVETSQESAAEEAQEEEQEEEEEKQTQEQEVLGQQAEEEAVHQNGLVDEAEQSAASQLSEEERAHYRHIFDKKADNGRLDLKGFKVLFRLMGQVLSSEDAEKMFDDGDRDDSGTIDFEEFCRLFSKFSEAEQERKAAVASSIEKLFPTADDKPVELKKVEGLLMKLQQPDLSMRLVREKSDLGQDDVKRLVRAMDKDGNGLISKHEFVETLCGHLQM